MSSTPPWLTELETKARAATHGRWGLCGLAKQDVCTDVLFSEFRKMKIGNKDDAAHIAAHSPERILALLKLVKEMGEAVSNCSYHVKEWESYNRGPVEGEKI